MLPSKQEVSGRGRGPRLQAHGAPASCSARRPRRGGGNLGQRPRSFLEVLPGEMASTSSPPFVFPTGSNPAMRKQWPGFPGRIRRRVDKRHHARSGNRPPPPRRGERIENQLTGQYRALVSEQRTYHRTRPGVPDEFGALPGRDPQRRCSSSTEPMTPFSRTPRC